MLALFRTGKITFKNDEAFVEGIADEAQERGDVIRVDGQWKFLIEAPKTEAAKLEAAMGDKMAALLAKVATEIEAGKYESVQQASAAFDQEILKMAQ